MITLRIGADIRDVERYLKDIDRKYVPAAASRAINKTLGNVRTEASKAIRQERALSASVVKDALKIVRATSSTLEGQLIASGRPIPLRDYQARETKKGVTVKVSPGARKLVMSAGNKAFIVHRLGGHVFVRVGPKRLPIKKLFGPSIPSTFIKDRVMEALTKVGAENWPKRFKEEIAYELSKRA